MYLIKFINNINKSIKQRQIDDTSIFRNQTYNFIKSQTLIKLFYALSVYIIVKDIGLIYKFANISILEPLWPIFWVSYADIPKSFNLLFFGTLITSIVCCFNPDKKLFRLIFFVFFFEYLAMKFSLGKINHASHPWLFTSFFLIFLPNVNHSKNITITQKHISLTVLWFCIFIILFFYSFSGFWKIYRSVIHLMSGEPSILSFDVFARQISNRLLNINSTPLLGPFFMKHHFLGWAAYLLSIYVELTCIIVAFRPSLHRLWGIMLIIFHIGVKLTMNINFNQFILADSLLLVCSPFTKENLGYKDILLELPLVSFIVRSFKRYYLSCINK